MEEQVRWDGGRGGAKTAGIGRGEREAEGGGGRPGGTNRDSQRGKFKKMVSPSSRRRAAKGVVEEGLGNAAQACRALGLARSSYYLGSTKRPSSEQLRRKIVELSEHNPRYGYRRITALLRRIGRRDKPFTDRQVRRQLMHD